MAGDSAFRSVGPDASYHAPVAEAAVAAMAADPEQRIGDTVGLAYRTPASLAAVHVIDDASTCLTSNSSYFGKK